MATYKKGFKKQNTETILLKIIIGIIIAVFSFVVLAFIYDAATQWKSYDYYTNVTEFDGIFELTDEDEVAIEDYVIYIYSDTCSNCLTIKSDVLKIGHQLNKDTEMFFVANSDSMTDTSTSFLSTIGENELGTPMLVVVADGEFYEVYLGSGDVVNIMESINEGTFAGFND